MSIGLSPGDRVTSVCYYIVVLVLLYHFFSEAKYAFRISPIVSELVALFGCMKYKGD